MAKQAERPKNLTKYDEFFDDLGNKSSSTISGYRSAIWTFSQFTLKLSDAERGNIADHIEAYLDSHPNIVSDLKKFFQSPEQKKRAPDGATQTFLKLTGFFGYYDPLTKQELKKIQNQLPAGKGMASEEGELTPEIIRSMLQHTDVKGKAIIMLLTTTGMRIGELLNIKCNDVKMPSAEIPLTTFTVKRGSNDATRKTKNGSTRFTFCTTEATEALRQWINVRAAYIEENKNRGLGLKNRSAAKDTSDDRLFPLSDNSVNELLKDVVAKVLGENAEDAQTHRSLIHAHLFRKYMISRLSASGMMSKPQIDFITGHTTGMDKTYQSQTKPVDIAPAYLQAQHVLYVEAIKEIREAASNNDAKFRDINDDRLMLHSNLFSLQKEKDALNDKLKAQQDQISEMRNDVAILMEAQALGKDAGTSIVVTLPKGIPADKAILLNEQIASLNALLKQWSE